MSDTRTPFVPPPYPYDRLADVHALAARHPDGPVDLSIGTPTDPPPAAVIDALADSVSARGYPPSNGTPAFRAAAADWLNREAHTDIGPDDVRATIGSKEFVAGLPHWLHLRRPDRDTVLFPAISYPSYAMGATLAGCRAVPVPMNDAGGVDLDRIDPVDAERALCLWVNSPSNPTGALDDLGAAASWGRAHGVPVLSDECYIAFTWEGRGRSILEHGTEGVLAVHSLSKRSNLAGARIGFFAGDSELVHYLGEVRKHAGFMCPGPAQLAGIAAFTDVDGAAAQRDVYHARLQRMRSTLTERIGVVAPMPQGGFYLWAEAPGGDAWSFAERLARELGIVVSPGEFYGPDGADHVRIAMVRDL